MEWGKKLMVVFIIIMFAVLFYTIGYGAALKQEVFKAEKIINDYFKQYVCTPKRPGQGGVFDEIRSFNFTLD